MVSRRAKGNEGTAYGALLSGVLITGHEAWSIMFTDTTVYWLSLEISLTLSVSLNLNSRRRGRSTTTAVHLVIGKQGIADTYLSHGARDQGLVSLPIISVL